MKGSAVIAACTCALAGALMPGNAAMAHRVDEYLQATMFALEADEVRALLRLVPGIAVAPAVIVQIDRNGDGVLSEAEERAYVRYVLGQLTVTVDGRRVQPRLGSWHFSSSADLRDGLGEIQIEYIAALSRDAATHTVIVDNPHPAARSVYLMNAMVPANPALRILAQRRSAQQSHYEVDFAVLSAFARNRLWLPTICELAQSANEPTFVLVGVAHLEGADGLLPLLAGRRLRLTAASSG